MLNKSSVIQVLSRQVNSPFFEAEIENVELLKTIHRRLSEVSVYSIVLSGGQSFKVCIKQLIQNALVHNGLVFLEQEYRNNHFLYSALNEQIKLPKVYGFDADEKVMITQYIEHSKTYEDIFTSLKNWFLFSRFKLLIKHTQKIAELLSQFHSIKTEDNLIKAKQKDNMKDYLNLRVKLIHEYAIEQKFKPVMLHKIESLHHFVDGLDLSALSIIPTTLIHGDFTPANLLSLKDNSIACIDFADVTISNIEQDIACFQNYLLMLSLNKFWFSRQKSTILMSEFEKSYWQNSNFICDKKRLQVFQFRMLLTNTLTLVYECQSSKFKSILFKNKIHRYVHELTLIASSENITK